MQMRGKGIIFKTTNNGAENMNKTIDVLTLGDLCVDLILRGTDVIPEFGQKEKILDNYSLEMGGSCSIFACQCSKLGLRTSVVGKVGNDVFGQLIRSTMKYSGVDTSLVATDETYSTGISVQLDRVNDRAILTYDGTIDAIGIDDITDELLMKVKHFHIGSYFLMKKVQPYYPDILRKLKTFGATISLDTNWDPREKWDSGIENILQLIDIFLPNENEAIAITKTSDINSAIKVLRKKVPIIALKKGKDGAQLYAGDQVYSASAIDFPKVDAIGAGDSFDGGFIYGFLKGMSLTKCLNLACLCGSMNTRASGGTKSQAWLEDIVQYNV